HKQLNEMNEKGARSVIALYTLMLIYAAAPFTSFHGAVNTGFFRVWGVGGICLSLTSWFYCDRTFWKYGHHLFEQVFCIRQLFQLDKIALGRCRLHNLYALLPSYGYSGDRMPRAITPAEDPTHISQPRIRTAARFFKLVNIFPVMYFCLFASMLFF